jgi:hypothetical protein
VPKPKRPPEKRVWARIVNGEWRVNLMNGEVLIPVRRLSVIEARRMMTNLPTFYLGFLMPVRELTGDKAAIEAELALSRAKVTGYEWNSFELFRGDRGTEAVVIEHHH